MSNIPHLINAWRKLDTDTKPFILDADRPALDEIINAKNGYHQISSSSQFCKSDLCQAPSDKTKFHFNLLPMPYLGNIRKAKVYILTLNPGFGFNNYYLQSLPEYRENKIRQLRQTNLNKEYPWIDPDFCWTGGFQYWFKRIRPVIERLQKKEGINFREALKIVSKNVATLELVPYHSSSYKLSRKVFNQMESPKLMLEFVKSFVMPKAKNGEALVICARKVKEWGLEEQMDNVITFKGHETRGAHLTGYTDDIVKMIRG